MIVRGRQRSGTSSSRAVTATQARLVDGRVQKKRLGSRGGQRKGGGCVGVGEAPRAGFEGHGRPCWALEPSVSMMCAWTAFAEQRMKLELWVDRVKTGIDGEQSLRV